MRIDFKILLTALFCMMMVFLERPLWAATIEVENDDDSAVSSPTVQPSTDGGAGIEIENPTPTETRSVQPLLTSTPISLGKMTESTPTPTVTVQVPQKMEKEMSANSKERVRISDKVNFFNFVQAGYLASDPGQVPSIGTIVKTGAIENYTLAQKPAMEVDSDSYQVKNGDLFFVCRCEKAVQEPHTGFLGYQVENLALVEVIEAQKTRHLLEVKKSFKPFLPGDHLVPYETEVKRWKQAQLKKPLPDHPVLAFVAGFDSPRTQYIATDIVLIAAGSKKGVVEGQKFQFFRVRQGEFEKEDLDLPIGSAKILYCGPDYSIARILTCSEPIETGFQAVYRP